MLVLSRKVGESVMINHNVKVTVVEVRGDKVRLGFSAPNNVSVDREEIFLKKHPELGEPKETLTSPQTHTVEVTADKVAEVL